MINQEAIYLNREKSSFNHKRRMLLFAGLSGLAWSGLVGLIFLLNVGDYDFWHPGRLLTYVLLLVAPALTFMPVGRALEFPLYGYWAVVSWALFGYVLAFIPADPNQGWNANAGAFLMLLVAFFMVGITITLPIFYRLGFRLFSRKVEKYDLGRARREAVLFGAYLLLVAFLRIVDAATLLNVVALFLAFFVLELLILTRNVGRW